MKSLPSFIVDAFTYGDLRGNPAAVVVLEEERDSGWMQAVAAEFNLSETAFLSRTGPERNHWNLRWFTPAVEVELCGHATLAAAHVLWQHLGTGGESLFFSTLSGTLEARRNNGPAKPGIALNFPVVGVDQLDTSRIPSEPLGLQAVNAMRAGQALLVELPDALSVRDYQPDAMTIAALDWRALIITARGPTGEVDFVSRFFAPKMGIPEDPVTGSVHCSLAPYWASRLGRRELVAEQWSPRGGRLCLELEEGRVRLAGEARTFLRGEMVG